MQSSQPPKKQMSNTKSDLIDAFAQLYIDTPIEKITVRRLIELAGYNRSTFYLHFEDIYAIREHIETHILTVIKTNLKNIVPITNFAKNFTKGFMKLHSQEAHYLDIVFTGVNSDHFLIRLQKELSAYWLDLFLSETPSHTVSPQQQYTVSVYFAMVINAVHAWINNRRNIDLDDFTQYMNTLLTHSIVDSIQTIFPNPTDELEI